MRKKQELEASDAIAEIASFVKGAQEAEVEMPNGSSGEIVLHLYSGQRIAVPAGDVAYIDEDRDATGAVTGTRVVFSKVDESGNAISLLVKETCDAVARQLSEIVGPAGVGDD
jgi:hypothetical protein